METESTYWTEARIKAAFEAIEAKLNDLAVLNTQLEAQGYNHAMEQQELLAPLKAELDALEAKWDARIQPTMDLIATVKQQIDDEMKAVADVVSANGDHVGTVSGRSLRAIYSAGRVTWDAKRLEGYALAHPEIAPCRKVGDPFITIKSIK